MDWVNFEEIKKTVTLQMALDRYGILLRRVNATTLRGRCPLPTHTSDKNTESFTANLSKGLGGAWACQSKSCAKVRGRIGGNVLDFVAAMEQCSVRDAAIKLQTWFLVPVAGKQRETSDKEPGNRETIPANKELDKKLFSENNNGAGEGTLNSPLAFTLSNIDRRHPYLKERGLADETIETFEVGFFPGKGSMHNRIVIPIHNATGELVAYAGRSIDGSEPRYKFPAGFHKSLELFNLHRVRGELTVVLVEGFFGCIKIAQAGFPCVALMGSAMSETQENYLAEHFARIVVMLDGDEAGRLAATKIVDRLQRRIFQIDVIALPEAIQPDQLLDQKLQRMLDWMVMTG